MKVLLLNTMWYKENLRLIKDNNAELSHTDNYRAFSSSSKKLFSSQWNISRKNVIRLPFMSNFIHWIDFFIILQWNDFVSSNIRRVFVSFLRIFSYIHWMLEWIRYSRNKSAKKVVDAWEKRIHMKLIKLWILKVSNKNSILRVSHRISISSTWDSNTYFLT